MASASKKSEKFTILEEIYDETASAPKPKNSFRKYFKKPGNAEKMLSGAILAFGLAAIALGFFQIKNDLRGHPRLAGGGEALAGAESPSNEDLLGLKQKDTDSDGLSDYDELYLYHTSPYLPDTDSDGINDQKEISRGSDPVCPEGQNCFAAWNTSQTETAPLKAQAPFDPTLYTGGQLDATTLREMLKQAGMTDADLIQLSDEELMAAYQQVVSETQPTASQSATTISLPQPVSSLTPAQIRQMLLDAGISQDTLNQVTDSDLMSLVNETIGQSNSASGSQNASDLSQVQNMPPAQIRQLLLNAGMSQATLDKVSDSDLLDLVKETLATTNTNINPVK